ncbi:MAG: hypothetical protein H0X63_01425 [Flavobacteriales bacterium]|jgi:hypothetical protein|nr:hypothetical protein [Flavobacteriales bacterium]
MIQKNEIQNVQQKWADGVIKIGSLKNNREACEEYTNQFLSERYAFDEKDVLFKPTKCAHEQFRNTKVKALSYFIAGDDKVCGEDQGFAITPWTKIRFENSNILLEEDRAIAMGNYYFTDTNGNEVKVEYTFGYKLINEELKIDLHHSSLPYQG